MMQDERRAPSRSNHRLLVQGDPGAGKTILASKIAYDWARGKEEFKDLGKYSLVFFIQASCLGGDQTLQEYIIEEY